MENSKMLSLLHNVGKLKSIKRAGWVRAGITDAESVADHSFRCTFMVMVLGNVFDVNSEKLLKMALIHDLAECVVGDITPHDGISQEEKKEKEHMAFREIFKGIADAQIYIELWTEYEEQNSREAIIIKNIDKLEMALTAMEYQKENPKSNLTEFIDEAERHIDNPKIKQIFQELKTQGKATSQ